MEAHNRKLSEWFNRVRTGQVLLPRFQRHEAWSHNEIGGLLQTVMRGLPSGATLILEVGDKEPFESRSLEGAPPPTERVSEHLLDGQQRLTALWRALHDQYREKSYFLKLAEDDEHPEFGPAWTVTGVARWSREREGEVLRYPLWADDPAQVHRAALIPAKLLRPGDLLDEVSRWVDAAVGEDVAAGRALERSITVLRGDVSSYNIPYLALPVATPKDVALDVFIKMNTSSVRLTSFDVVVAQFEARTGQSLHDLVEGVQHKVPGAAAFRDVGNWVLDIAALWENRTPAQASYLQLDLGALLDDWDDVVSGIEWAVSVLHDERVFDGGRLPTVSVLPVLAALGRSVATDPDHLGEAKVLIRRYVWRSFLTSRYESSAGSRALQDYQGLKAVLEGLDGPPAPILDEEEYPLPGIDEITSAGWPKRRDIRARGLLAVSLRAGGRDLADDASASSSNVGLREYHHLFPDSLLTKTAGLHSGKSFRAMNCALITWRTNRKISAKEPVQYLRDRAEASSLGKDVVRVRLSSHLIPYDELAVGGWDPDVAPEEIATAYEIFLAARAALFLGPIRDLCDGLAPAATWSNPLS